MKKMKNTFGENLEQIEIAKLKLKYEELGYNFFTHKRLRSKENVVFEVDAFAKHPETKEEIIFEVKAKESVNKGDTKNLVNRRDQLLKHFPKARFVLVLAKEPQKQIIETSRLNDLILDYIKHHEWKNNFFFFNQPIEPTKIESLTIEKIDFKDFKNIDLEGYGNYVFTHYVKNEDFEGKILSDGIPFQFKINLFNNFNRESPFSIDHSSKFKFDISEFNT